MILIFVLWFKLSILHLCVSDPGYSCRDSLRDASKEISLFSSDHGQPTEPSIHEQLNREFVKKCRNLYDIQFIPGNGVMDALLTIRRPNLINLYYHDYYKLNDEKHRLRNEDIQNHFEYAGDINDLTETKTCVAANNTKSKYDCDEKVKLMSKQAAETNKDLYDFVEKIQIIDGKIHTRESCSTVVENTEDLKTVLICLKSYNYIAKVDITPLNVQMTTASDCQSVIEMNNNNFLAVLAPKPFYVDSEYTVPVVFYDTPYMFPENETHFPNSMTVVPWRLLKYAFLMLLRRMDWQRVVVVSDDSVYSIGFEKELITLFNEERLTYTVLRCEESICDMRKISKSLEKIQAWIVIANVEAENARYLVDNNHGRRYTWLVRDRGFLGPRVFSLALGSEENHPECNLNNNVLDGLSSIAQAYRKITYKDYELSRKMFYRKFGKLMRETRKPQSIAFAYKGSDEVLKMHVNVTGAEEISFKNPFENSHKPLDGPCLARSHNFFRPCEDDIVIVFMFVIIIFCMTLLLINCYFQKTSPFYDIRYYNF